MVTIKLREQSLSDQSKVYSIVLIDRDAPAVIELPCVTLKDAIALQEKIERAITDHTNEEAIAA